MTLTGVYLLLAALAWPVLVLVIASRLNHLRRGPTLSTVAGIAALAAAVWPLAAVVLFVAPRAQR